MNQTVTGPDGFEVDPADALAQKDEAKLQAQSEASRRCWEHVLSTQSGRRVLLEILELTGYLKEPQFKGQSNQTMATVGKQSVGFDIFSRIRTHPDHFHQFLTEMFTHE